MEMHGIIIGKSYVINNGSLPQFTLDCFQTTIEFLE